MVHLGSGSQGTRQSLQDDRTSDGMVFFVVHMELVPHDLRLYDFPSIAATALVPSGLPKLTLTWLDEPSSGDGICDATETLQFLSTSST